MITLSLFVSDKVSLAVSLWEEPGVRDDGTRVALARAHDSQKGAL